jgi:REP element-mobilizing transposase RayT
MNNIADHHRRSIRLKGYDYSLPGYYYVTICVHERVYLFGNIRADEMILNDAGQMINKWCAEIPKKFECISLDSFVIMPNHIHAIFINTGPVGADLCVCPKTEEKGRPVGVDLCVYPDNIEKGRHAGLPLQKVVQWFKTMTTNEYIQNVKRNNWQGFTKRLWQRNYYEHIIRNEEDYYNTKEYIISNPKNWGKDKLKDREDCEKV